MIGKAVAFIVTFIGVVFILTTTASAYIDPDSTPMMTQIIVGVVFLLLGFLPAILVFKDAKKNDISPPFLWALLVFVVLIIGLIAYLIVRNLKVKKGNESNISSADELTKYKKLLDDGVITQEEFDIKKKQLLE